ncbi:MAG TPA: NAD-dependent malic enzyme [Acidimicrobiia bacterium]|nr:NAD-dependent malic enzyme [Acidimicrobiia bacterium]
MRFRPAVDSRTGELYLPVGERGRALLEEPLLNKGTAFSAEEREQFDLTGYLPSHVSTMDEQLLRVRTALDSKSSAMEKHIYLAGLHDRNETLFFRFVLENLRDVVPLVYTPTVAEACANWSRIFRRARGIYITPEDRGGIARLLRGVAPRDTEVIVVTDNERILGIGDQGAGGMGIPIGKLALYTAAAGIHPARTLPISLDVGTENRDLLDDPMYLGWRGRRERGEPYWTLVEEFVLAVKEVFPDALLQWEDFANTTSFRNLATYQEVLPSFNDDIQGTAAVVVAGLLAAMRRTGGTLADQRYVIVGSGSAGLGIYDLLAAAMIDDGLTHDDVRGRVLVLDSSGPLIEGRPGLVDRKRVVAVRRDTASAWGLTDDLPLDRVVEAVRPTVLIGVCGQASRFTESIVKAMAASTETPVVMPLSNPTAKAEAAPADILRWTEGRAIVATGSPFDDVVLDGRRHRIGQANNVFAFPGIGLGVIVSRARQVTAGMFMAASRALASTITPEMLDQGSLYPPIEEVRRVSRLVAHAVADQAVTEGVANPVVDVEASLAQAMWRPVYLPYRRA